MIHCAAFIIVLYSNFVTSTDVQDPTELHEKIYWGQDVRAWGKYPYFCSIQLPDPKYQSGYRHFCGGALVERRIVITAAHCLTNASLIYDFRILPNYRNSPFAHPSDRLFKVKRYLIHPDLYKQRPTSMHDIGIILLDKADTRTNARLELPFRHLPVHTSVTLMGYGLTEFGDQPYTLKEVTVVIQNDKKCLDRKTGFEYAPIYNFCTQNSDGGGGCYRDAGSPAVWTYPHNNLTYLYGVLSSEQSPCNTFHTDVFVNVFANLKFINDAYLQFSRDELGCPKPPHNKAEQFRYEQWAKQFE